MALPAAARRQAAPYTPHFDRAPAPEQERRRDADHLPQLDGIRCYAAVMVVAQHVLLGHYIRFGASGLGVYGVWVFFVLSGFLITGILLRARDASDGRVTTVLRSFYARRFLRIFPLYYAALLFCAMVIGASYRRDIGWHVSYLSNWHMSLRGAWDGPAAPLWSLGIEEQFYLVWPAIILLTPKRRIGVVLAATVACGILSRATLALLAFNGGSPVTVLAPTTSELDPLAIGALLAWHRHVAPADTRTRARWTNAALASGLVMLAAIAMLTYLNRGTKVLLVSEATAAALVAVWIVDRAADGFREHSLGARVLGSRLAMHLGVVSYGIYILHTPVRLGIARSPLNGMLMGSHSFAGTFAYFVAILAATALAATLSWYGFERPINGLKRRFPYPA